MKNRPKSLGAFTLVELLVVVAIMAVLSALILPNVSSVISRAEGVVCTSKLRNLCVVFSGAMVDGTGWPQVPKEIEINSLNEQRWWLDYSSNVLGMTAKDWQCPTITRNLRSRTNSSEIQLISYLPTLFDANPNTPRNWPRMPWFTETQNVHGHGNLCVRADGSVSPIQEK